MIASSKRILAGFVTVGAICAVVGTAVAHKGATGIVKQRMDAMESLGDAMKILSANFKPEQAYDAKAVAAAATTISGHSGEALTKLFPKGSLKAPSVAKKDIWQQWSEFSRLAEDLKVYSAALAEAAPKGRAGDSTQAGGMMGHHMSGGMMGHGGMMGGDEPRPDAAMLSAMPTQALFAHVAQACSSCHTRFRTEKKHH